MAGQKRQDQTSNIYLWSSNLTFCLKTFSHPQWPILISVTIWNLFYKFHIPLKVVTRFKKSPYRSKWTTNLANVQVWRSTFRSVQELHLSEHGTEWVHSLHPRRKQGVQIQQKFLLHLLKLSPLSCMYAKWEWCYRTTHNHGPLWNKMSLFF